MTEERQDILQDFYQGNSKKLVDTIHNPNGSAKDLTGAEVTFALFDEKTEVVLITKSSTGANPGIVIDDAPGGVITIHLLKSDTHNLNGYYRYHVNVVDADGNEETVTTGRINIFKAFAKRKKMNNLSAYLYGQII